MRVLLLTLLLAAFGQAADPAMPKIALPMARLAGPLKLLTQADQQIVEQAIHLIRLGNHALALARLNSLNTSNPVNSTLRILTAYSQLQLGNILGAYEEGKIAESSPNGTSYKCYFLAKLALLAGDVPACRRELGHVAAIGDMKKEVRQLSSQLEKGR